MAGYDGRHRCSDGCVGHIRLYVVYALRERTPEQVGHVSLATLEHGQAHGFLGTLRISSVLMVSVLRQYCSFASSTSSMPGRNETNRIGSRSDRCFLEAVVVALLHALLRHDPAGAGGGRAVEGPARHSRNLGRSTGCILVHIQPGVTMRTNIVLDDQLVKEAFRHSRARTKKDLVHEALRELIRVRSRRSLLDLRGKIRFSEGYDCRQLRTAR